MVIKEKLIIIEKSTFYLSYLSTPAYSPLTLSFIITSCCLPPTPDNILPRLQLLLLHLSQKGLPGGLHIHPHKT